MAALFQEKNGSYKVQYGPENARKTITLGKMKPRDAERAKGWIEDLLVSGRSGRIDEKLRAWLDGLDDKLHARLAKHGLVEPREHSKTTLGSLLENFFATIDVKPGTKATYEQTRDSLETTFGKDRLLSTIKPLDCDKWRQEMKVDLADATVSKRVKTARQIFRQGIKWKMLTENPLADVKAGPQTNRARMHFVTRAEAQAVLDHCPDHEWKTIFALSRFGGLRCPSEHLALRWDGVDWDRKRLTVQSPKTEGYEGGECRIVPLFPELEKYLLASFQHAAPRAEFVIAKHRVKNANLRTQLRRILKRASVKPWPRLFHNLRSSRQTELAETYPIHVVCAWLGNSAAVAADHYLQIHDAHFERATAGGVGSKPDNALRNRVRTGAEVTGTDGNSDSKPGTSESSEVLSGAAVAGSVPSDPIDREGYQVTPAGFEPASPP